MGGARHLFAGLLVCLCVVHSLGQDCVDLVAPGLSCADLPDPCNDTVGKITCAKFCGLCSDACAQLSCLNGGTCVPQGNSYSCKCPDSHTGLVCHIPSGGNCPTDTSTSATIGCKPAEVVFMIEYGRSDLSLSIDHEGDFIKELVDKWPIGAQNIRIGLVIYHDTVSESFHIGDYNTRNALKGRITQATRGLRGSGTPDLAKALDYVRTYSFTNARPGVERVVIPIVHQMDRTLKSNIPAAATNLKNTCVTLFAATVSGSSLDSSIMQQSVTQPYQQHINSYNSFIELENAAKFFYRPNCS